MAYLGGMFGAASAAALIANTSQKVGSQVGKRLMERLWPKLSGTPYLRKPARCLVRTSPKDRREGHH